MTRLAFALALSCLALSCLALGSLLGCGTTPVVPSPAPSDQLSIGTLEAPKHTEELVFAVVGDTGYVGAPRAVIADSVTRSCGGACSVVLMLGDNLYPAGVVDEEDAQRLACMVKSYPTQHKLMALGNHDYAPVQPDPSRAERQLAWVRAQSAPGVASVGARGGYPFYGFDTGLVRFFALDTNYLVRNEPGAEYRQLAEWARGIRREGDGWTIVFGHHTLLSNGAHGNAGRYRDAGMQLWHGKFFELFMQRHVIGKADMYLSGHDHNMQFFAQPDLAGTALAVVGSGSKCTPRGGVAANSPLMERYGYGYAIVRATPQRLGIAFYDYRGEELWQASRSKDSDWQAGRTSLDNPTDPSDHCAEEADAMQQLARAKSLPICP